MNQEVSYQTSGIGAETSAGGVRLNMIPREGGNRFSGDFKPAYRPGDWQGEQPRRSGIQDQRAQPTGNAHRSHHRLHVQRGRTDQEGQAVVLRSARYFSVNNFIADTFIDDGSQGIDDQFIRSALAAPHLAGHPATKFSRLPRRDRQVPRPRHAERATTRRPRPSEWYSPAYHTTPAKLTSHGRPAGCCSKAAARATSRTTPTATGTASSSRAGPPAWFANAAQAEARSGRPQDGAAPSQNDAEPGALQLASVGVVRDRLAQHQGRASSGPGAPSSTRSMPTATCISSSTAATATGKPFTRARHGDHPQHAARAVRRAPELRPRHLRAGHVDAEAADGQRRHALGGAQRAGASRRRRRPAGSCRSGRFAEIENLPNWKDSAPRFAAVYDLFGNAKTALKYSLEPLQPGAHDRHRGGLQPARSLGDDGHVAGADVARPQRRRHRAGRRAAAMFGTTRLCPGCEINFARCRRTSAPSR